jgi:hypothetical protein
MLHHIAHRRYWRIDWTFEGLLRGGIICLRNLSLLSTCTQISLIVTRLHRQATSYFQSHTTFPYYRSCEHVCKPLLSSHNVSLLSTSTGNQLCSASHNFPLLSLMWTCTQTAFIVTQRLIIVHINRQPTIFSVTQCFPIIAHANMHANSFSRHTTSPCYRSCQHETLHRQASN